MTPFCYYDTTMSIHATTIRFDTPVKRLLKKLSELQGITINRLANEAVREYALKMALTLEQDLESTLADLRAYRENDPDFELAITAFAEAEVSGYADPAEGHVEADMGPTERTIRTLLSA